MNEIYLVLLIIFISLFTCSPSIESAMASNPEREEIKILLLHGFYRDGSDMVTLKEYLEEMGYQATALDLPLTFDELEDSSQLLEERIDQLAVDLSQGERIALVGHSTGGLVIRHYLQRSEKTDLIGNCVLIATPNQGSSLAGTVAGISSTFVDYFATLDSISPERVAETELYQRGEVAVGAIAGNSESLVTSRLLEDENDGLVEVSSVKYDGLEDFIVIPYSHQRIHYQPLTAQLVDNFLRQQSFVAD